MIPLTAAVVLDSDEIDFPMDVNGKANIKSKKENKIEINCKSKTGGLLVLSEIYYEPGWKAFINGKETKFIKQITFYDRFRYRQGILRSFLSIIA